MKPFLDKTIKNFFPFSVKKNAFEKAIPSEALFPETKDNLSQYQDFFFVLFNKYTQIVSL